MTSTDVKLATKTLLKPSSMWLHVLLLVTLCAVVYGYRLGDGGLTYSEGHRVEPAYEMLDSGQFLVPRLFDRPYLRKPPGINWVIAASSAIFGRTEFAARLVSALAIFGMSLLSYGFAKRWFGWQAGLASGIALLLMPVLWESGRAAEIEALHNFFTLAAALVALDMIVHSASKPIGRGVVLGLAIAGMVVVKGPAGLPVLFSTFVSAMLVTRSWEPVRNPGLWIGGSIAAIAAIGGAVAISAALKGFDQTPVTQSPEAFLYASGVWKILLLVPASLGQSMPAAIALFFPWGLFARREAQEDSREAHRVRMAQVLSLAVILSFVVYAIAGVGNPRYTLPACVLVPTSVGYLVSGVMLRRFLDLRVTIGRWFLLGSPWVWVVVLTLAAMTYTNTIEQQRRSTSGRDAGWRLGVRVAQLTDGTESALVYANGLIEARPEVLLYAGESCSWLRGMWVDSSDLIRMLVDGDFAVLRTDGENSELEQVEDEVGPGLLIILHEGRVHKYSFALVQVAPAKAPSGG